MFDFRENGYEADNFSCRCQFCLPVLGSLLSDSSSWRKAGFTRDGECRGGDQEKRHGIILAKSIPAKKYHIQTGETVVSAKEKCPGLILVPLNYDLYNRSSKALIKLLSEYTDKIEQYSIDEAFLDMTGCWDAPERTAHEIKIECVQNWGLLLTLEFQKINCSQRWLLILQSRTESTLSGNQKFKRRCGRFQ